MPRAREALTCWGPREGEQPGMRMSPRQHTRKEVWQHKSSGHTKGEAQPKAELHGKPPVQPLHQEGRTVCRNGPTRDTE